MTENIYYVNKIIITGEENNYIASAVGDTIIAEEKDLTVESAITSLFKNRFGLDQEFKQILDEYSIKVISKVNQVELNS